MAEANLNDTLVLIAGATSLSGEVMARALVAAGARVIGVGHHEQLLDDLVAKVPGVIAMRADLSNEAEVAQLAERVHAELGPIDGLVHLVGGWRGGGGLAGQSEDDFRFLEISLTALRHVSRAFYDDLQASPNARIAMVSSTAVGRPLAGGANYAAVKAASEAWARALAQGFAKAARDAGRDLTGSSVIYRVKALDGLEAALADAYVSSFAASPAETNDQIIKLELGET